MDELLRQLKREVTKGVARISLKSKEVLDAVTIRGEIDLLKDRKKQALTELGTMTYSMRVLGNFDEGKIQDKCRQIDEIDQDLQRKLKDWKKENYYY